MYEDMSESTTDSKMHQEILSAIEPYPFNSIIASAVKFGFKNRYESVTIVDKNYIVQFLDPPTEKFLGLQPGGGTGRDIRKLAPASDYELTITTGTPVVGRIRDLRGVKRISSVYPLISKGKIIGAIGRIVFYSSFEEIKRVHEEIEQLKDEIHDLRQRERNQYSSAYSFENILGTSRLMREAVATAKRISTLKTDVLIEGESGTGKELFAHSIHSYQHRDKPFVRINCPAIPFELAESQLFGYEKGAFTGASMGKAGVFEVARNGIVFLDEISSLALSIQAKLLRVLQEREIQRLGSNKTIGVDFRFIAASNADLQKLVDEGKFRHDLYYRVARVTLRVPPLRERPEDIPLYLHSFLETINKSFNTRIKGYSNEAMDILVKYGWPGNVRQLMHVLEQIAINAWDVTEIGVRHLPKQIIASDEYESASPEGFADGSVDLIEKEKQSITFALKKTKGNKRKAARLLNIARSTLYEKLQRYSISVGK